MEKNYEIEYTDNLPNGVNGMCMPSFPFLFGKGTCKLKIRPKYKDDKGLLEHEVVHAKQYARDSFFVIKYFLSSDYRYECELEAYTAQLKYNGISKVQYDHWAVKAITSKYRLHEPIVTVVNDLNRRLKD